jgi:L-cystine transport system permease protein
VGNYISISRIVHDLPIIIAKFPTTLMIVIVAILIGVGLGLVLALLRVYRLPVLSQLVALYVSFIRGTPMIVQLFLVLYGLPFLVSSGFGVDVSTWSKIIFVYISYGLNQAAYLSEIFRSAIMSVPQGQVEAAASIGLTGPQTFFSVVLPQSFRVALPSLGTSVVYLFQGTSVAFTVGIVDVVGMTKVISENTLHTIDPYIAAAVIFIVVSLVLGRGFDWLDRKYAY